VQELMSNCATDKDKFYFCISSSSIKDKPVQLRPWCLNDTDFVFDSISPIDPRKTIFVGGVPRPLKSSEKLIFIEFGNFPSRRQFNNISFYF
jgi:cytoplasmic polyadenylation element-binding protein